MSECIVGIPEGVHLPYTSACSADGAKVVTPEIVIEIDEEDDDETSVSKAEVGLVGVEPISLSAIEHSFRNWTIGSETGESATPTIGSENEESESHTTDNVSWKDIDTPDLHRKPIDDVVSYTSDSASELDSAPTTIKKPRPREIDTLTHGDSGLTSGNSLHVCGWESDDSDVRHRSDSNASSQPLLSPTHASSTELMIAARTEELKSKQRESTVASITNLQSPDDSASKRDATDEAVTTEGDDDACVKDNPDVPPIQHQSSIDTAMPATGDAAHKLENGVLKTDIHTTVPVSAVNGSAVIDKQPKPTLKPVPTATLLINEQGVDVIPQIVTSIDDIVTSMKVVKQISYQPPMPDNYLVLSCIVLLCCNPFFGLLAFVFSGKSTHLLQYPVLFGNPTATRCHKSVE